MAGIQNIHHIAVVVEDFEKELGFWRDVLGLPASEIREAPAEKSQVVFLSVAGMEIELVKPNPDNSSLSRFLAKRGSGLHHICLEVDDLDSMLRKLQSRGVRLVNATPLIAADGRTYAFIHPESASGVLVELYQSKSSQPQ